MIDSAMPGRDIGLIVDEWGVWNTGAGNKALPGKYLFEQESTMREAVIAALTLNIFNNYCDKVVMANVAQLVNCIHSLFLAKGDRLVTTTSYHVFDMYKAHQNAVALKTLLDTGSIDYEFKGQKQTVPGISCSASVRDGVLTVTLANISLADAQDVEINLNGGVFAGEGSMVTLSSASHKDGNTFAEPGRVVPKEQYIRPEGSGITVNIPAASVVMLRMKADK